jgi:putative nucleotidyltransferase with HDIG domain
VEIRSATPGNARALTELWLDSSSPSEADLRAANSLAARLAAFEGLRPFSGVVETLVAYIACPDFKLDRVRKMVESDPALAARIMRVANSAAYRAYEPCSSIAKAIVRIGAGNVSGLAMAMSAMTFFKDLGGVGQQIRDHSAGTAVVARELAMCMDQGALASKVFLAGLLHDIGKLLLLQTGDAAYDSLLSEDFSSGSLHLKEQALLGFDHAILGGHVLQLWKLPQPIPQVIASHHQPKAGLNRSASSAHALNLLRIADVVDWLLGRGYAAGAPQVRRLAHSPDGVRAGLREETLPELWDDLRRIRHEALLVFK